MTDAPQLKTRTGLIGYWWAPVALIAVALAVVAYLHPYQPLDASDLPPEVLDTPGELAVKGRYLKFEVQPLTH